MITSARRRRAIRGLSAASAVLLLAACSSGSSGTGTAGSDGGASGAALPKTLVFSPLSLQPPALKGLSEGVKSYAGTKGWTVVTQDPNFDPAKQTQQLNEVISSGRAGAAWIIAVAPQSLGSIIKAAQAKGIPVLVNGKPEEWGFSGAQPGVTFDYIDYAASGKALGEQTGKCITEKLGGNAEVLFNQSAPGQAGKAEFEAAAVAALKTAAPNAEIVQKLVVKTRAGGQTDVGNALQGHPNLKAVMSSTDEGALGAAGAFKAAGKDLPCNVDFGGNDEVLREVESGAIYASVALQLQADMAQAFDTLVTMQSDPKAAGQVLTVPIKVVTSNG